jgi:hypothetical protein
MFRRREPGICAVVNEISGIELFSARECQEERGYLLLIQEIGSIGASSPARIGMPGAPEILN